MQQKRKTFTVAILITLAIIFAGACYATAMEKININTATLRRTDAT